MPDHSGGRPDAAMLRRLRRHLAALQAKHGRARLAPEIVRLAAELAPGTGLTVDLDAVRDLGHPLVILRGRAPAPAARATLFVHLTSREREVAALVVEGLANKEIAARLSISLATAKEHVHRILEKTKLPSRAAVIAAFLGRA